MKAKRLIIVGDGPVFKLAAAIAAQTRDASSIRVIELPPDQIGTTQLEFLDGEAPAEVEVFAAVGMQALNYARFDLWAKVRLRGFRCASLTHRTACVEATARMADNCLVGPFCYVGPDAEIGRGSVLVSHASMAVDARVGAFCWLQRNAAIGAGAKVGSHVSLGEAVRIGDGVVVGDDCEISIEGTYRSNVPGGSFVDPLFATPVRLYGAAAPSIGDQARATR